MKIDELRNLSVDELRVRERELVDEIFHLRLRRATAQLSNPMKLRESGKAGETASLVLDANGLAEGGVRTPWVDVPTSRLSGIGNSGGPVGFLAGVNEPFDAATLDRLYPGGKADYLKKFEAALASSIKAGFILAADKQEILNVAAAMTYRGKK